MKPASEFFSSEFLKSNIEDTLRFYSSNVIDSQGGFNQNWYDNGTVFDSHRKHLVSSCRMIFNFCKAESLFNNAEYRDIWQHGLKYLRETHWQEERQGYSWLIENGLATDETNHCYGLAFVLLAFATTLQAGDEQSREDLYQCWELLEKHFWQPEQGLYADEISADWQQISEYRGQNANMHCCEALILAYEATRDQMFLDRAFLLADTIVNQQTIESNGLIWEHFDSNLAIDWNYNIDDPENLYRPWGYQPGHQTEWSKLLLMLYKHSPKKWLLDKAEFLFEKAMEVAWDDNNGGMFYGFDPEGNICDSNKYFWVQAESMAAAGLLFNYTKKQRYLDDYNTIWEYCWTYFVDHQYGAWFRILSSENLSLNDQKSVAGAKCDYHNLGACSLLLETLDFKS